MDTHGIHRREPHSALRKKRFQPARLPGLHGIGLENSGASRVADRQSLEGRQFSIPGFTFPLTDLFPPSLPTPTETSSETTPTPASPTSESTTETTTSSTTEAATTTTSSTTESTTSESSATTSSSSIPTPTPTPTPPPAPTSQVFVTEVDNETAVLTKILSRTTSSTSATSSPTTLNSTNDDDGSNTGPIIGGVVAGLIALAVLVISLVWFFRRRQRERLENDVTPFNPHDFRRSAYLIDDEPKDGSTAGANLSRGPTFNYGAAGNDSLPAHTGLASTPRPPSMIERKLAHTPVNGYDGGYPSYNTSSHGHGDAPYMNAPPMPAHYYDGGAGAQYGYAGTGAGPYGYDQYGMYGGNPHFSGPPFGAYAAPGQVVNPQNMQYAPGQAVDPNAQNPFMTPAQGYAPELQSPFSPPGSVERVPAPSSPDAVIAEVGGAPVLTRNISGKSKHSGKSGLSISIPKGTPVNATVVNGTAATIEGQDAAAAYPAIKRQASSSSIATLKRSGSTKQAPVPALPTSEEEVPSHDYVDLSRSSVSPYQALQYAEISRRLNTEVPQGLPANDRDLPAAPTPTQDAQGPSPFADPSENDTNGTDDEFQPPKPPGRSPRIESLPPQLPEISIGATDSARSSNSFMNPPPGMSLMTSMGLNSAKDSPIYPSGITAGASPMLGKFPVTPSPLGGSFGIETPKAEQGASKLREEVKGEQVQQAEVKQGKGEEKQRPMTVYDEADAYGGI